ncbi:MAG: hypothetical protein QOC81_3418 [Thermoanaerobaculia bacterium]|nr:hypothetical protein [Thermoanaerobaculia bacterium]
MKTLMPTALLVVCCIGFSSNAFAANCFCKFYVGSTQIGSTTSPNGGFLQTTCAAQTGCHDYCKGYLNAGNLDAAAAAHRCGSVTISIQASVGTEGYCSVSQTRNVTGTGVLSCPAGYWSESGYGSQPNHPVCVKQACPQGTMPGAPPWHLIFGNPSSGGAYLTDDKGGTRFFIDASCH